MFLAFWSHWLKGKIPAPKSRRHSLKKFRPALEALEARELLSFAAPVSYSVGTQNTQGLNGFGPQVITGDFNGDGRLDLAATSPADGTVNVLLGNGNGTFQPAASYSAGFGSGGTPYWLAAADFNGDGHLDLAVEGNNSVSILLGNGDGTFQPARIYSTGSGVGDRGGLAVGDYFGNGRPDVAVAVFGNNTVEILPNNGDGTFGAPIALAMPTSFRNIRSIVTADFFGNGRADLAVAGNEGYNNVNSTADPAGVALFKNDGTGHFTFTAEYLAVVTPDPSGSNGQGDTVNPEHVDAADLNHDGKPDLVLSLYDHNIDVFLNNGNGTFKPGVGYTTETPGNVGGYPRGVTFADVNGDGNTDIITDNFGEPVPADQSSPQPGSVGILYGKGDGTFQAPIQLTPYKFPGSVAVGDFNGDGSPDLTVTQNYDGHSVGVMLNTQNFKQDAAYLQALYQTNLGRSAGQAEINSWEGILGQAGRQVVARGIVFSSEARTRLVQGWYVTYLGRTAVPAAAEVQGWVSLLQSGVSEEVVLSDIIASPEFYNRAQVLVASGAPDQRYVAALYSVLLHRTPGPNEVAAWMTVLPSIGYEGAALGFLRSVEYREDTVRAYYSGLLHRTNPPSQSEIDGWALSSLDLGSIRVAIEASYEFYVDA
jgi:hypothetical protein